MLVSVPYAFKAHEAETLNGHQASEFVTADSLTVQCNSNYSRPRINQTMR